MMNHPIHIKLPFIKQLPGLHKTTGYRVGKTAATLFKVLFLLVICFTVVYPFITKTTSMFMSRTDLTDSTVKLIPKAPTLWNITFVFKYTNYINTFMTTFLISLLSGVCSALCACLVGWGLARYKFFGRGAVFAVVVFVMILPPQTIMMGLFTKFRDFDIFGLFTLLLGKPVRLSDGVWPVVMLASTGLIFRGGLYIFIMRQFYSGIPKELVEAARIDGCGHAATFVRIVLPLSTAMLVTILLFSFAWMWSDTTYAALFYNNTKLFANQVSQLSWIQSEGILYNTRIASVLVNTGVLLSMLPLLLIYVFLQKFFVEGVERSGITG